MELAVNRPLGGLHVESDGIVDPIADRIVFEGTARDSWGKGKGRRIESGKIQVKIDGAKIAGRHRRKPVTLASRVGTREVDTQMVAKHEARNRMVEIHFGPETDANYNCSIWLERSRFIAC